jgi:predicted DsbA family dithiol-disulfide isomerase
MEKAMRGLQSAGAPYGVEFGPLTVIVNSRPALEASEFAKDRGRFPEAHSRLFRAYFQEGENIGEKAVVLRLMEELGLNVRELEKAFENRVYFPRLEEARRLGKEYGVAAVPTFIVNEKNKIVGAQPYAVFQRALQPAE